MPKGIRYDINPLRNPAHIEPFKAYGVHNTYRKSLQGIYIDALQRSTKLEFVDFWKTGGSRPSRTYLAFHLFSQEAGNGLGKLLICLCQRRILLG